MVNILASRAAAGRLAAIIAVLLLPLSVLSYWIIGQTRSGLELVEREQVGMSLLRLSAPLLMHDASKPIPADILSGFLDKGAPLAEATGVTEEFNVVNGALRNKRLDRSQFVATQDLMVAISNKSRMNRDAISENLFLARAVAEVLPRNWGHIETLFETAKAAKGSGSVMAEKLAFTRGELSEALKELRQSLGTAANESLDDDRFSIIVENLVAYELLVQAHISQANKSASETSAASGIDTIDGEQAKKLLSGIWWGAADRLSVSLDEKRKTLEQQLWLTNIGVLATVLIGLASAVLMFRSTLRRLDDVEVAKKFADSARQDSEAVNTQLTEINSDIVRLNQELADKMRRLKDAQDELVRKGRLEQLGQLTATVAHELRNPLGAVRTAAFLLERRVRDKGLGVEGQLMRINNGVSRCDNIITQLLDFSRTRQVVAEKLDMDTWLERLLQEEARRMPTSVSLQLELGLSGHEVEFDPARLQRAVINMINNASEAMVGQGNDETRQSTPNPTIIIETKLVKDGVLLSVTDNGPGIPEELLAKIRDPLFTTKSFGTGLGIPAVEQIAVQHGGSLEIHSQLGRGAKFTIAIPIIQPVAAAA
jgi:signal transduction histidine kinase